MSYAKLVVRGCISNTLGLSILALVGWSLDLWPFVGVALAMQWLVYLLHGLPCRSEAFYDLSGSVTHLAVVLGSLLSSQQRTPRQLVTAVLAIVWMTRLGCFLFLRISKDGKDGRFDHLKPCFLSFLGAWTIQAVWVTLVELPVVLLNAKADAVPLGAADAVCLALWLAGFLLEAAADNQKFTFRTVPENKQKYITTGVWRYSRHPNYCGEILMWVAMAACATACAAQGGEKQLYAGWVSPAFTALLLLRVTGVPQVEAAGAAKWGADPAYQHYMKGTSRILPWFPAPPVDGKEPLSTPLALQQIAEPRFADAPSTAQ
jgi:steroid 5-alpha reductase family enzyme